MTSATTTPATATATAAPRLPPGPGRHPWVHGARFVADRHRWLSGLQRRYGDAATVDLPHFGRVVAIANPELVKDVYRAKPSQLNAGTTPFGALLGEGSLFAMDGERHLAERRLLLAPFHGDRMRAYEPIIEEETRRVFADWPEGEEFRTVEHFNRITLRVILRAVFGAEGGQLTTLEELIPRVVVLGQRVLVMPFLGRDLGPRSPGGRLQAMRVQYRTTIDALIDRTLADPALHERIDILSLMLRAIQERGEPLNREHVGDELLTMLVAGHETTASSLAWTIERVRRHPEVLRRLEAEAATEDSTYRTAVVNEVMRVRSVIPVGLVRQVTEQGPFQLGEWTLPPGTWILNAGAVMQEDSRFHEDAHRFNPDRYVGKKPDGYAWIPFGGGVRRCIGAAFAQLEMDVVLRMLLREFELQPTDARSERVLNRGVATLPAKGGRAVVRRRALPLTALAATTATASAEAGCPVDHAAAAACPVDHAGAAG